MLNFVGKRFSYCGRLSGVFFVGKELGKMGDKMGGGERRLLPIAFLPVFPFIIDIFCETSPFLSFINTSFYSCNVGYPRLRFHGRRFQLSMSIALQTFYNSCFSSLYIRVSCVSTYRNVRSYFRDNVRLYLRAG